MPQGSRSRTRSLSQIAAAILFSLAVPGCQCPEVVVDPARTIPAFVVVRPVAGPPGGGEDASGVAVSVIDPAHAAREVARVLREGEIFSAVGLQGEVGWGPSPLRPDYICEVEVRGSSFAVERSEATSRAVLSTLLYPAWWINDRRYPYSDVEVRARFVPAVGYGPAAGNGPAVGDSLTLASQPLLTEIVPTNDLELDLAKRGAWYHFLLSILLPTFWMQDDATAERSLEKETVCKAPREIAEQTLLYWAGASLSAEPGCCLLVDPPVDAPSKPATEPAPPPGRLRAWLASRQPVVELRVFEEKGKVLARLDRAALEARAVTRKSEEDRLAFDRVKGRLGPNVSEPAHLYRLDIDTRGAIWLRLEAWTSADGPPARFTVQSY